MPPLIDTLQTAAITLVAATLIIFTVVLCTRIVGLRSFSKMSAFDFAMTIAVGSILATGVVGPDPKILHAILALAAIFAVQVVIAMARRSDLLQKVIDNEPVLLMENGEMLEDNMQRCRVTQDDLRAKLREANVLRECEVRAVVLETTGDISVLHGTPQAEGGAELEEWLMQGVRR